jgi:hypothetical protein
MRLFIYLLFTIPLIGISVFLITLAKKRGMLKLLLPVAACFIIAVAIAIPLIIQQNYRDSENGATLPPSSLSLNGESESAASYSSPEEWRGLQTDNFILDEQKDGAVAADRPVFRTLDELAQYADMFAVIVSVREVARDGDNIQSAIAEYTETIGDRIVARQWDDRTVSTGSRVLIRQKLIGGCTMDEPSNLLRKNGVYVLPIKFNGDLAAYEATGDFDALFELDSEGRMLSHSRFPGLNRYDGMTLPEFLEEVRGLYPTAGIEFIERPIGSVEQAEKQANDAYITERFRKFSLEFDSETVVQGADVYLFKVFFGDGGINGSEYAAIAKLNGAFLRLEKDADGKMKLLGGLGEFPKNSGMSHVNESKGQ